LPPRPSHLVLQGLQRLTDRRGARRRPRPPPRHPRGRRSSPPRRGCRPRRVGSVPSRYTRRGTPSSSRARVGEPVSGRRPAQAPFSPMGPRHAAPRFGPSRFSPEAASSSSPAMIRGPCAGRPQPPGMLRSSGSPTPGVLTRSCGGRGGRIANQRPFWNRRLELLDAEGTLEPRC